MNDPDLMRQVRQWLQYAREDLEAAEVLVAERRGVPRHACFLAQQAAEKALKAILVFLQIDFPKIHDLNRLRTLVPDDWSVKVQHPQLGALSAWAIEPRYPGDLPDSTEADAHAAVAQARAVWESVCAGFARHGFQVPGR